MKKEINRSNLHLIKKWGNRLLVLACLIEFIIYPSFVNILGCLSFLYGWWLLSRFVLTRSNLLDLFLPTFAISGLVFCYYFLPLIVTLTEGKPLSFNFEVPFLMFLNHILNITVIVGAYLSCKQLLLVSRKNNLLTRLWGKLGYFRVLNERTIWAMSFLSLFILFLTTNTDRAYFEVDYEATGNAANIINEYLQSFIFFPYALIFQKYYGSNEKKYSKTLLILYSLLLLAMGLATTRRYYIATPIATVGIIFILDAILNNKQIFTKRNVILSVLGMYLVTGPVADIATAMALNRHNFRGITQTISDVVDLYQDKELLYNLKQAALAVSDNDGNNDFSWSEYYVDNVFLDRFCNIRVQDASLYYAQKMGFNNPRMHEYFIEYLERHMPSFIANELGIKKTVFRTPTDMMVDDYFQNNKYAIAGSKVGGETGIGLYLFGYWYYPFAFFIYVLVFYFLCSLSKNEGGRLIISIPVLATLMTYFRYFDNAIGIFTSIGLLMRNGVQNILFFCLISGLFALIFKRK